LSVSLMVTIGQHGPPPSIGRAAGAAGTH